MRIENMTRYGAHGWQWEQVEREWHTGRLVRTALRTNESGNGRWRECWNAYGSYEGWRQDVGTSQLSLPSSPRAARAAIRRYDLVGAA